jgi:hypothetical protein
VVHFDWPPTPMDSNIGDVDSHYLICFGFSHLSKVKKFDLETKRKKESPPAKLNLIDIQTYVSP